MVLKQQDLINIHGGASVKNVGLGIIIAAFGSFIIGIIDGFLRPLKCNV